MNSKKSGAVANDPPGSEGLVLTNKVYANDTYFCLNRSLSLKQDTLKETLFAMSGMVRIYA